MNIFISNKNYIMIYFYLIILYINVNTNLSTNKYELCIRSL